VQLRPSPAKPGLHVQVKFCLVLRQSASLWQGKGKGRLHMSEKRRRSIILRGGWFFVVAPNLIVDSHKSTTDRAQSTCILVFLQRWHYRDTPHRWTGRDRMLTGIALLGNRLCLDIRLRCLHRTFHWILWGTGTPPPGRDTWRRVRKRDKIKNLLKRQKMSQVRNPPYNNLCLLIPLYRKGNCCSE